VVDHDTGRLVWAHEGAVVADEDDDQDHRHQPDADRAGCGQAG
jgi:hypothetical protein